jgi:ATP-dependent protease ClpP protease subunit
MKKVYFGVAALALLAGFGFGVINNSGVPEAIAAPGEERLNITLDNSVMFADEVTSESSAKVLKELLTKNSKLKAGQPLYLIVNSPGGEVTAGEDLIAAVKQLGRPVHTITLYAASMGSNITNRLGKRFVHPNGLYMYHRMRSFSYGQIPGEYNTDVNLVLAMADRLDGTNASRLGLSLDEYRLKVINEYYVSGSNAVNEKSADAVANISCNEAAIKAEQKIEYRFWGVIVEVKYSRCPAIIGPVAVEIYEELVGTNPKTGEPTITRRRLGFKGSGLTRAQIEGVFGRKSPTARAILPDESY